MGGFSQELRQVHSQTKRSSAEMKKMRNALRSIKEAEERGDPLTPEQKSIKANAASLYEGMMESLLLFGGKTLASAVIGTGGALYALTTWDYKKFDRTRKWIKNKFWK